MSTIITFLERCFDYPLIFFFFFFNDTATTEIYTLSLHDALPIFCCPMCTAACRTPTCRCGSTMTRTWSRRDNGPRLDRKSTRLNSSHGYISYAVFCLKKKNEETEHIHLKQ